MTNYELTQEALDNHIMRGVVGIGMKTQRKRAGLTQATVAERLGVTTAVVCQYECGKRNPKISTLEKYASVIGCDVMDFFVKPEDDVVRQIGQRIREERKVNGWTQSELGKELGVGHAVVSKWERGEVKLIVSRLVEICEVLQVSADSILGIEAKTHG